MSKNKEKINNSTKDQDFELIRRKIAEAAQALNEAGKIAYKYQSSEDEYDTIFGQIGISDMPLLNAMDYCGWNTSSFGC